MPARLGNNPVRAKMYYYTYIIQSKKDRRWYTGFTVDIRKRLKEHNEGSVIATKAKRPWQIEWFCGFHDEQKATVFEKHMKTGSGSAFRFKHFASRDPEKL